MTNGEVDRPGALAMQAWLRETARNTRSKRDSPYLSQAEINLAPHVAFRLEQAADMLGELEGMRLVRRALEPAGKHEVVKYPDPPYELLGDSGKIHCPMCCGEGMVDPPSENRGAEHE